MVWFVRWSPCVRFNIAIRRRRGKICSRSPHFSEIKILVYSAANNIKMVIKVFFIQNMILGDVNRKKKYLPMKIHKIFMSTRSDTKEKVAISFVAESSIYDLQIKPLKIPTFRDYTKSCSYMSVKFCTFVSIYGKCITFLEKKDLQCLISNSTTYGTAWSISCKPLLVAEQLSYNIYFQNNFPINLTFKVNKTPLISLYWYQLIWNNHWKCHSMYWQLITHARFSRCVLLKFIVIEQEFNQTTHTWWVTQPPYLQTEAKIVKYNFLSYIGSSYP